MEGFNVTVWEQGDDCCRLVTHMYVADAEAILLQRKVVKVEKVERVKIPSQSDVTGDGRWGCE